MSLELSELVARARRLPSPSRELAVAALEAKYGGGRRKSARRPEERAAFLGNPHGYIRDIFGYWLTPQQEHALDLVVRYDKVLIPSGNAGGKTFLLALVAIYFLDVVAAQPDEGGREQGARVLLPGPDHATVYSTIYSEMLVHAEVAERRGHPMPGERSDASVHWRVRPQWGIEAFSPPTRVNQNVSHTASGRHHRNMIALVEEGQGVPERLWKAVEGMCSSDGNKIVSSFNPTEAAGPTFQRAKRGDYKVYHMDIFQHPNVLERRIVVQAAKSFKVIDDQVLECRNRGKFPEVTPEHAFGDFVYALPPSKDVEERGARPDGILGHPDGQPCVFRPTPAFEAQVRGQWPRSTDTSLFNPGAWDTAVERWLAAQDPEAIPDRLGVDVAREGKDETCYGPSWGLDAEDMLRQYGEAAAMHDSEGIARLLAHPVRVGELKIAPKGTGPEVARHIAQEFASCPWLVDITGGIGASLYDHAKEVLDIDAHDVSFSASAPERVHEEPYCENVRAALYVRASMLVNRGLCDVPDDPILREEVMAHELVIGSRSMEVEEQGRTFKRQMPSVRILSKDEVKAKIGRSPDRADAFVLSLWKPVGAFVFWAG